MSFAMRVKDDLARVLTSKTCCRKAELAAFFRLCGNVRLNADEAGILLRTENTAVARKFFVLVKESGLVTQLALERKARLKKRPAFSLKIPPQAELAGFLYNLGLTDSSGNKLGFSAFEAERLTKNECCRRAYLRGAYLALGYISRPEGAYHLEFSLADLRLALFLQKLVSEFAIFAKLARRKGLYILYLKDAEQISLLLNIIGAHRSMLEFESMRVDKDLRNQVNRLVNCDKANVDKTVAASLKQIERLRFIEKTAGLSSLKPALREVAMLRLQHPEATLSELADLSGLGRSAINHRLRHLMDIAAELDNT
ncbi:MAG: DNA-binding protein WhiA [Clostridiales bacterium]|nr:DNA-binding protein WhiA [Clostridiales bacterium]